MYVSFTGHVRINVITCHAAPNTINYSDAEKEDFYNDLSSCVKSFSPHEIVIVAGDQNAHLGRDVCNNNAFYVTTNENGQLLVDFAQEHSLSNASLKFNKKKSKKVTWTAPNGQLHQNDHILISSKWQNSLKNCESYTRPSVGSDHRIVTATFQLSLRANIKKPRVIRYDWSSLKTDSPIKTEFVLSLHNRYEALRNERDTDLSEDPVEDNQHSYTSLITAIDEAAEKTLPNRRKSSIKAQVLSDPSYKAATKARDLALKQRDIRKTRAATRQLQEATRKVREIETSIQEAFVNDSIANIDDLFGSTSTRVNNTGFAAWQTKSNSSGIAWRLINDLTNRKPKSLNNLPGYKSKKERAEAWTSHYSQLLYNPADKISLENITVAEPQLPISTDSFTEDELHTALSQTRDTYGHDGIPSLLYKTVDLSKILLPLFNTMLATGSTPEELLLTAILPIPKRNKRFCPENSRGISILPVATKLYNRLLLNRIRDNIEPHLRYNQNGFRPGRGTREHILALRRIIEEVRNFQLPCVISFIDFSKAFDCIFRSHLPDILASYGFPSLIIKAIMSLYINTKAKVLTPEGATLEFLTNLGILQGDVLAPLIFIIVLDYILRLSVHASDGFRIGNNNMADLEFADDIATVTDSILSNTILCQKIADTAARFGLMFNISKTQYMFFNIPRPVASHDRVFVNGNPLEEVGDFKYLGSYVVSSTKDIQVRKAQAWKALESLDVFWKSDMSRKVKTKIFRTAVEPVLLYGSETWTLKVSDSTRLDGVYTRMLRRVYNISWESHTTNTVLYGGIPPLTMTIKKRRLRFAGHLQRHDDQPVHELLFWQPTHGKRYRGRPYKTFPDVLYKDTGLNKLELRKIMHDRKEWRAWVEKLVDPASST